MDLRHHIRKREQALVDRIAAERDGVDDAVGKGGNVEQLIARELLEPHLPPGFDCNKGTVVMGLNDVPHSPAHDRVIWDRDAASPLIYGPEHSVFPIEAAVGAVEITINMDRRKLREDVEKLSKLRAMRTRRYWAPILGQPNRTALVENPQSMSPRAFIVGVPADPKWRAETIAKALTDAQTSLGPDSFIHGAYIIGVGFFSNPPGQKELEVVYTTDSDKLFRFTSAFRSALDRWPRRLVNWTADVLRYMPAEALSVAPSIAAAPKTHKRSNKGASSPRRTSGRGLPDEGQAVTSAPVKREKPV